MAFDVSALANYVKEHGNKWLTDLITGSATAALIQKEGNLQVGVKSASTLNILDTDAIFQQGGTCGFNASGSTAISQRQITVGKIKVHERLCPKDLEAKFTQESLTRGSTYDEDFTTDNFVDMYLARKASKINSQLEKAIWQGDTASGNVNLNKFDGFLKLINAASGTTDANVATHNGTAGPISAATGVTAGNVIGIVKGMLTAMPLEILDKDDVVIMMGTDKLLTYSLAITAANQFHYTGERVNNQVTIPGTNQKVIGLPGLNGTNTIVATPLSNLYAATDLANEEEKFEFFFAKEADEVRFMAEWKYGVQIAFPSQVVKFTMA